MFIETVRTQAKLAVELHAQGCAANPAGHYPRDLDKCPNREMYIRRAAAMLGHLLPTIITEIVPAVRADEREKVAYRIEAELVCCDLYDKINREDMTAEEYQVFSISGDYHAICHWGGYAAAIARDGDGPGHEAPDRTDRWQVITDEIKRLSEEAGYGTV